jgi:hypothetical protein
MRMPAQRGLRASARGIVREILWVTAGVVACGVLPASCSSQGQSFSVQIPTANGDQQLSFDTASCPHYPQSAEMDRVCMIDSNGKTYPEDGTLWTFPAAPPYAVYYQFKPGYAPAEQDVDTTSDNPSVGVFAAPYQITPGRQSLDSHCCAEDSLANRIPSHVMLTPSGGLLVAVTDAQPSGDQLAVTLSNGGLFKSRLNPCTLPDPSFCQWANNSGFAVRFYVGAGGSPPPPPPDAGPPPAGACLLEYNDALVSAGADTCCYRQGGTNNCHTITQCNDLSGAGCCLVYGTDNTAGGGRCCLYESGELGDDPTECQTLLAAP